MTSWYLSGYHATRISQDIMTSWHLSGKENNTISLSQDIMMSCFTVPKLSISQSEALFTVMIFYDIKSLTWYPTISWTVSKTRTFLQTLEMKITTEIQRNVKLFHVVNEKVICWTPKLDAATLAGARVDSPQTFSFQKWSVIFQISPLIWIPRFRKWNSKQRNYKNDRWGVREAYWRTILLTVHALYDNSWLNTVTEKISPGLVGRIWVR